MTVIAVYIEGGGDSSHLQSQLRTGFDGLFSTLKTTASGKKVSLRFICRGSRQHTYDAFMNALKANPDSINMLLVDSEDPIPAYSGNVSKDAQLRVEHLTKRDKWILAAASPERIHLMAQCMEAWIVSDPDTLASFYGRDFKKSALPARMDLEQESKGDIYDAIERASSRTQKGPYAKIKHASQLLQKIDGDKIEKRCFRFGIFRNCLQNVIDTA